MSYYRSKGLTETFKRVAKNFYLDIRSALKTAHNGLKEEARLCELLTEAAGIYRFGRNQDTEAADTRRFIRIVNAIEEKARLASMTNLRFAARDASHNALLHSMSAIMDDDNGPTTKAKDFAQKFPSITALCDEVIALIPVPPKTRAQTPVPA